MTGYKETGQYAYEGYANAVNWTNYAGQPMPKWDSLPEKIQDAWREAAHAVFRHGWQEAVREPDRGRHANDIPADWKHVDYSSDTRTSIRES